jgi:transcriptional regulator with XRE-family HTH domain
MIKSGKQLKAVRTALEWSQADLAARARVHEKTIAYWEGQGDLSVPRKYPDRKLSAVLGVFRDPSEKTNVDAAIQQAMDTAALLESLSQGGQQ